MSRYSFQGLKLLLPHLALLLISALYTFAGAAVFMHLEQPHFEEEKAYQMHQLQTGKEDLMRKLWDISQQDKRTTSDIRGKQIDEGQEEFAVFVRNLYHIHGEGRVRTEDLNEQKTAKNSEPEWSFTAAVFFVVTTLTTIGISCTILVLYVL